MPKIDELSPIIDGLIKTSVDADTLKQLGSARSLIDEVKAEEKQASDNLEATSGELAKMTENYRAAVMNAPLKPTNSFEEKGSDAPKGKTLEQIVEELSAKK